MMIWEMSLLYLVYISIKMLKNHTERVKRITMKRNVRGIRKNLTEIKELL